MSEILNQLYLIKVDSRGLKSEVPVSEANFLVGNSGTVNFGLNSVIFPVSEAQGEGSYIASVIGGGAYNSISGLFNVVQGGLYNSSRAYLGGVVGGGTFNQINSNHAVIAGGNWNCILSSSQYDSSFSFIGGGSYNKIQATSASTTGETFTSVYNNIVGGFCNCFRGAGYSLIGGGEKNCVIGNAKDINPDPFIQLISGRSDYNFIGAGIRNTISGNYSSILGGSNNSISSDYASIIGGRCASILRNHSGAMVLGDGQNRSHFSSGPHTLTLDFANGIYFKGPLNLNQSYIPTGVYSPGISGQVAWDEEYMYICSSGNGENGKWLAIPVYVDWIKRG